MQLTKCYFSGVLIAIRRWVAKDIREGNCDDDCSKSGGQSDDHAALSLHFAVRQTGVPE